MDEFVGDPEKTGGGKRRTSPTRAYDRAQEEIAAFRADPDRWASATPAHFVALYAWLHAEVYGAAPAELRSDAWWGAVSAATKMLREEFSGEPLRMLDFVRWTWRRERAREQRPTRDDGAEARRIGWRLQFFLRHLVTDYRVEIARTHRKVNR